MSSARSALARVTLAVSLAGLVGLVGLVGAGGASGCGDGGEASGGAGGSSAGLSNAEKCGKLLDTLCGITTNCPGGPTMDACQSSVDCSTVTAVADDWDQCVTELKTATCDGLVAQGLPPVCDGVLTFPMTALSAQAAVALSFTKGETSTCDVDPHTASIGMVSTAALTAVVTDGSDGATVSCSVTGPSSGPFEVTGTVTLDGATFTATIPTINLTATKDEPAHGALSYGSPKTGGDRFGGSDCLFFFEPGSETAAPQKIWVSFSCIDVSSGSQTCTIESGTVVFEDCDAG